MLGTILQFCFQDVGIIQALLIHAFHLLHHVNAIVLVKKDDNGPPYLSSELAAYSQS